ncbi:MAG TPA: Type 1 glutamine amidotransferase-like domain-containing protein [Candidatus Saccharimonadales bacterium]|nr:Type 1 glutamine amidotransferase-like domain-containing protein [Candidatus Saccharimonadales bacterium]
MRLLLTSNGLSNDSIAAAFQELVGKEPARTKVAFIPTAANTERGNKDWLIDDMYRIKEHGYVVDIVELNCSTPQEVQEVLEASDVIFVGGGNTFFLSYCMRQAGLFETLPELLKTRVYAGISAGSMITGQSLVLASQALKNEQAFQDEYYDEIGPSGRSAGESLKFVDLIFRPHLNSRFFTSVRKDILEDKVRSLDLKYPVYALDDMSALKIVGGNIDVVSEGEWLKIDPAGLK